MEHVKYLVLGGGISGLAFANAAQGRDCLVLEKDREAGGYCKTKIEGDFVWDYAGHFFHFKTERWKNFFLSKIKESDLVHQEKCTKILYRGKLIDYPFQMNIHQLEKDEFIDCLYDLFSKTEKDDYDNFSDMLYGKFGKSIVEKFLRPYNEKLYAVDLTALDKDAMGRFFPYANKEQIVLNMKKAKNTSYNDTFLYPKRGAGFFVALLKDALPEGVVRTGSEVCRADVSKKTVTLRDGSEISYDYLINTAPLNHFLPLTGREDCLGVARNLSYNKVLVFNLGYDRPANLTSEHWIYVPDKQVNFYRVGFYNHILGKKNASLYIEIGYPKNGVVDEKAQLRDTLENLVKTGIMDKDARLIASQTILMDPAYVHINADTDRAIRLLFEELNRENVFSIGRYGAWTYCSMEDCMIMASDLYQKLSQ